MTALVRVEFPLLGKEILAPAESTVADACALAGRPLPLVCGGRGACGKCRSTVTIAGARHDLLACQEHVVEGMAVLVPPAGEQGARILTEALLADARPCPELRKVLIRREDLPAAACSGLWELAARQAGIPPGQPRPDMARALAAAWPSQNAWTLVLENERPLGLEPGDTGPALYGVAIDLGTTTLAAYLHDLNTGKARGIAAHVNAQAELGGDVLTRIQAAGQPEKLARLQSLARETVNRLLAELCAQAGIVPEDIWICLLCGNSAMQHLFFGFPPKNLGRAPFHSATLSEVAAGAAELGLGMNPAGVARFLPLIGGFVGADTLACAVALRMDSAERPRLLIDIGTNCEILVGDSRRMLAASAAAGPAFEGAEIVCGMNARNGAIHTVNFTANDVCCDVIGEAPAQGLCGSALVDCLAQMLDFGLVTNRGRLLLREDYLAQGGHPPLAERLVNIDGDRAFLLVHAAESAGRAVYLSQKDIRALQLATGAIRTAYTLLLERLGLKGEELEEIVLCGAFGAYLNQNHARRIGMAPDFAGVPMRSAGNAAGAGARLCLISGRRHTAALELTSRIEHVELSTDERFSRIFMHALNFDRREP